MDSISILALTVIAAVPALFVAARIFLDPTTGLCLWVLLLPVTKTLAEFVGYPGGAECAGNCNVLQKLTLSDLVLLLTLAGLLNEKKSAGATGTVLMWHGSMDNLLVQGGRVAGLFEGINQLQSFVIAVIPFFCAKLFSRAASRGTRVLYGALVVVGFAGVVGSGSRAGVVFAALSVWLMALLASPRVAAA